MQHQSEVTNLIDLGVSNEDIVNTLQPSGRTNRPIPLEELRWYLRDQGLLFRGVSAPFVGPFATIADSDLTPVELRNGLIDFITHVFGTDQYLNTTDPVIAGRGVAMLDAFVAQGVMTVEQRAGFYNLGGGLSFADLTIEQVAEIRRVHEITLKIVAAYEAGIASRDAGDNIDMVHAASESAWGL